VFSRIQWRIAASYVTLVAAVLLVLGVYLVATLHTQQLHELEGQLDRQARIVADDAQFRMSVQSTAGLDPLAKGLGHQIGARVTIIGADGAVLGDSDADPATMENHGSRPEVVQALAAGNGHAQRHSATLDRDLLYVAVPIVRDQQVLGVARVALPIGQVQQSLNHVTLAVVGALAVAALLAVALSAVLARLTTGPLAALTQAAQRLARGQLDQTIAVAGRDEVSELARSFNHMAAELRRTVGAMEEEREKLRAMLSHMADGLVIVDGQGVVRLVNPAAVDLLGLGPGWAEGRSVMTVVRDHELGALVQEVMEKGTDRSGEQIAPSLRHVELASGGRRRAVQALASRIPGGDEGEILLILQDVTELRRTESVRREFVANVSHELRTPVASLKALVETLEDGALEDPPAARDFLGRMHVEVDGLAQLVEELLELSRVESGQVALQLARVDVGPVVSGAAERLRPQAERERIILHVDVPSLPAVQADATRLQQVVTNLVHNAIKFTPPGGRVTVAGEQQDGEVSVTVSDTGVGIAPEALPRLFERFYKAERARASGGTGLGLAIAKHVVQAHGGRIWASSAGEGRGSTFTFILPVAQSISQE
jgi:two-component system, OmpR family, phosphate regulon sensor histidine kinase PhoR